MVILWDKMTTLEGARHVLTNSTAGRQSAAPLLTVYLSSTRFQQAGNPLLFLTLLFAYFIDNVNQ